MRQIIWIVGMVSSLKVLSRCRHTLAPPHRHVIDGLFKFVLWCSPQECSDLSLQSFNIGESATVQLGFKMRKSPKVAWGQVWTIGWVGQEVNVILSIKGQGGHGNVDRRIVHVQYEILVCVAIEASFPHDWTFVADAFLQSFDNRNPIVTVNGLPPWQKFQVHHPSCVKKKEWPLSYTQLSSSVLSVVSDLLWDATPVCWLWFLDQKLQTKTHQ